MLQQAMDVPIDRPMLILHQREIPNCWHEQLMDRLQLAYRFIKIYTHENERVKSDNITIYRPMIDIGLSMNYECYLAYTS